MPTYDPKIQAAFGLRCAESRKIDVKVREGILAILRAGRVPLGARPTEGAIVYALREFEPWRVRHVLGSLVGSRVGAVCTGPGEARVIGWDALGCEVFGLREAA
jgi:hypothetical protein